MVKHNNEDELAFRRRVGVYKWPAEEIELFPKEAEDTGVIWSEEAELHAKKDALIKKLAFFVTLIAKSKCVPRSYAIQARKIIKGMEV